MTEEQRKDRRRAYDAGRKEKRNSYQRQRYQQDEAFRAKALLSMRASYQANRDARLKAMARVRAAMRAYVDAVKAVPCQDCGRAFPAVCMDFDHRVGEQKLFNIGESTARIKSLETMKAEIAKCDVVCSNCHRIRTAARRLKRCH
jgi:hypothetical protein